jgi:hypothetical protein
MKDSNRIMFIAAVIFLLAIVAIISPVEVTGKVTYEGGTYSCTVNGKTYDKCMWVYLTSGDSMITNVPWAAKTVTGVAGYIRDYVPGANVNPQANAWIDLTDWINNKIYDSTPKAFKDLNSCCTKSDGSATILVAWKYKISDSYYPGWKWIDVNYDYYYEGDSKQMYNYESSSTGFYYRPETGEIDH